MTTDRQRERWPSATPGSRYFLLNAVTLPLANLECIDIVELTRSTSRASSRRMKPIGSTPT
jgi:hypothetical protein